MTHTALAIAGHGGTVTARVAERPILFSAPMVRALLDGSKTQTRRVVKAIGDGDVRLLKILRGKGKGCAAYLTNNGIEWAPVGGEQRLPYPRWTDCAPYEVGDRLWVRETFAVVDGDVLYRADMTDEQLREERAVKRLMNGGEPWRPSIFMPRAASRITLEVTEVRVQRVQEISGEDARAEGVRYPVSDEGCPPGKVKPLISVPDGMQRAVEWGIFKTPRHPDARTPTHDDLSRLAFSLLWDSINGKRGFGWDANPWCWCVSFRRVQEAP